MKKERKKNAKERSSSSYIKEFIPYYKPNKKLLFFDMLCSAIATAVELVFPSFAQRITNEAIDVGYVVLRTVLIYGVILLALRSVEVACRFFVNKYGHIMGVKIESDLRRNLFGRFQLLSHGFYDENKVGSLMSRITTDLFDITEFSHHCPETLFISGLKLIGIFTILMIQQPLMTLCVFAIIPVMAWLTVLFNGRWDKVWQKNRHNQSEINAQVEDTLSGIRVVKSFANEDIEQQKFDRGNKELVKSKSEVYHYMGVFFASLRGMDAVMYVFILILGGLFKIDAGLFVAYLLYATVLMSTLISFADYSEQFERGITAFKRYQQIMDTPVSPADKEDAAELKDVQGNVRFDNVTFSYSKDGKKVLDKLNLTINKGEIVALVGPSGGGKTTIAGLIPRFYDVTEGAVTVDGIDVRDVTMNSLRKNIGMVQQDVYLFWGTVAENIAYGKPDATREEIEEAAKMAGADEFIRTLPDGYESYVGERGVKLSGGQKQRISIARVFLKNPPIIILDEATSALDNESEVKVQQSLDKLAKGRTSLIIAHRLSTIRNATKIIVITERGIQEQGTHDELMEHDGIYKKLYELSRRTEILHQELS